MTSFGLWPSARCAPGAMYGILAAAAFALAGCGQGPGAGAPQTAAKVNDEEITVHQINFVLQQQRGLAPEQADAARAQILERLIDQELAVQKAEHLKVDRDPRVVQQIDAARREILARALEDKVAQAVAPPTADEVRAYFERMPALFKARRVYSLQEIAVEATPEQVRGLEPALRSAKDIGEFVQYLKANGLRHAVHQMVRPAEQLPLARLDDIAAMKDGQSLLTPTATGAQVLTLLGSRTEAVDLQRATPAIERFLLNERKREVIEADRKARRAEATIEYQGKFQPPPSGAGTPRAPASATAASAPGGAETDTETHTRD